MTVCNAQHGQGRDFGVVGGVPVTAFYGTVGSPKSASYRAASCVVTTDNFVMQCNTVAGVGAALAWTVEVGGQASAPSLAMVAYTPPVITSVTVNGGRTMRTWLSASTHIRPLQFVQTLPHCSHGASARQRLSRCAYPPLVDRNHRRGVSANIGYRFRTHHHPCLRHRACNDCVGERVGCGVCGVSLGSGGRCNSRLTCASVMTVCVCDEPCHDVVDRACPTASKALGFMSPPTAWFLQWGPP